MTTIHDGAMDSTLIESLRDPKRYPFPVRDVRVIQTHISWVLLTGTFAYKIKKPVNLGFLDFSTLSRREFYCREELRLNTRWAPGLYLDVVPITGSIHDPRFNGPGPVLDYAVRMREFDARARLDAVLERGELNPDELEMLADRLADWHERAPRAESSSTFGSTEAVLEPARENFAQIRSCGVAPDQESTLNALEHWTKAQGEMLAARIATRKLNGKVRECHGDLHTRNIAVLDGRFVPFDALEFDASLRWIDVISELAFLVMDLEADGYARAAHRVLNRYFEITADDAGLALLPFYLCYRAMVRAKVALLSARDAGPPRQVALRADFERYMSLAARYTRAAKPALILMHGVSGSGKSTVSAHWVGALGALRVRSDFERKRLAATRHGTDIYSTDFSALTYRRLIERAHAILDAGFVVILDATYLRADHRAAAVDVARERQVPWAILACGAPESELRERVRARAQRRQDISDADVNVLDHQLTTLEPLTGMERDHAFFIGPAELLSLDAFTADAAKLLNLTNH